MVGRCYEKKGKHIYKREENTTCLQETKWKGWRCQEPWRRVQSSSIWKCNARIEKSIVVDGDLKEKIAKVKRE